MGAALLHYVDGMAWAAPEYSRSGVDRAAQTFMDPTSAPVEREDARAIINNWRSSHSFPLNTMQVNLRNRATRVDPDALVAQRIKRLPSIEQKLDRFSGMRLSRMQDIGGCRAVVADVESVRQVVEAFRESKSLHELIRQDDYVDRPQTSGYRSWHLVYRYKSETMTTYNGLAIEVQVRTRLQHAWATAVETVGTFTRQSLKSSRGEEDWLRFFALMGSAVASIEGTASVPGTPVDHVELKSEIRRLATDLDVINRLEAFADTLRFSGLGDAQRLNEKYYVLELDVRPTGAMLSVTGFREQIAASDHFATTERLAEKVPSLDVVMVSVGALVSLRRAYPNYYLDTKNFRDMLSGFLA
jgi:hypothetical protein